MHDFRRTGARNLVRAGVSENTAMRITGHKTRSIFDRYDIVSGSDLQEAAEKMNVFTAEQKAKAKAARKGQLSQFKKQRSA